MNTFTIGFQPGKNLTEAILRHADRIGEVYFAWGDFSTGRGRLKDAGARAEVAAALGPLHEAGIKLNLLLNAECYGAQSLARDFYQKIGDTVDELNRQYSLGAATVSSPVIARFLKRNFPKLEVRASVNLGIGDAAGFEYTRELFDGYCLKREYNRRLDKIREARAWCDRNGKKLYMLANSGCLDECPARHFHDSLVAHEEEIAERDNAFCFEGLCRNFLRGAPEKFFRCCGFVRPEDLGLYDGLFDAVKLATRTNPDPVRVLEGYLAGHYRGGVPALLEPDHSALFYPWLLENARLPGDFGRERLSCQYRPEWLDACKINLTKEQI